MLIVTQFERPDVECIKLSVSLLTVIIPIRPTILIDSFVSVNNIKSPSLASKFDILHIGMQLQMTNLMQDLAKVKE